MTARANTLRGATAIVALACALPVIAGAQQGTGVLTGRVTDETGGQPIAAAQISVVGTNLGALTNEAGQYTIRGVPARAVTVRVLRVGYKEATAPVTVSNGGTATLDLRMGTASITLTPVVTTATGETRRVELGNAVASVDASALVGKAPITNVADLIGARAPGVQVLQPSTIGTAPRVRIRGTTSLSLSNNPIYVIDGVRMTSNAGLNYQGGSVTSRAADLNPDDIENIEIVKGPSAATLYGTDAANGVIVITTKKGRAGAARWSVFGEGGTITQNNDFPTAYTGWGTYNGARNQTTCYLSRQAAGTCQADSVSSFNLFEDPETTPFGTGTQQKYGASVAGGTDVVRYFVSGDWLGQTSAFKLPEFNRQLFNAAGAAIPDHVEHPNRYERASGRANLNAAVTPKLDIALNTSYITVDQTLPASDNNTYGLFSNAYGGPGYRQTTLGSGNYALNGYRALTPGDIYQYSYNQQAKRFLGSVNAQWRPTSWWQNRANVGLDFTSQLDHDLCRRGACPGSASRLLGYVDNDRTQITNATVDLASTVNKDLRPNLNSKTTVGAQYINYDFNAAYTYGTTLPPGATTITSAAVPAMSEATTLSKTLGLFVEEALALNDRLFLTGALRTDQNSAFGTNFQRVVYPKASVSWITSQESWFPTLGWMDQLRLRASYGAAGQQPGANDALRYFAPVIANADRSDLPGVYFNALGNSELKPERATEFEAGFEARLLGDRLSLEATYYSKMTRDALIARVVAPSAGVGSGTASASRTRFENLGSVKNAGVEALVRAQLADVRNFGWDVTLNGSTNANKLVSLGEVPPQLYTTYREQAGYPLHGWWERKYTYADANGDGIVVASEMTVDTAASFLGYSTPRHELAFTNGLDFLGKRLRLQTLVDWKGGYKIENVTEEFRCSSRNNCRAVFDKTAPLADQARAVAIRDLGAQRTYAGFIEDGSFVRLREASLTWSLADDFVRRYLKTRSASLTLAGRNLKLWSDYSGIDPEMVYGTSSIQNEFQTAPPPTTFTLRVNLGF